MKLFTSCSRCIFRCAFTFYMCCLIWYLRCRVVMEEYWPLRKEQQGGLSNASIPCSHQMISQRSSACSRARVNALYQHSKVQPGSLQSGHSCSLFNAQEQHQHNLNIRKNITMYKYEFSTKMWTEFQKVWLFVWFMLVVFVSNYISYIFSSGITGNLTRYLFTQDFCSLPTSARPSKVTSLKILWFIS